MLDVFAIHLHTCMKTLVPLLNCIVNDARVDVTPHLLQMLFQFISVVHLRLVHSRLDDALDPVIKRWAVHWPKIRWNERCRRCLIEKSHIVVCPVCWGVVLNRGRPKVEIPLSAITKSRPKVTCHIRPKPYVPPKVKTNFRPKTETESQSYLSRHDYRSQQVKPSVRCPTIPCI